ncbi:hypothetical protein BT69DRAFT_1319208 [Atractiella rhizophila]|nr:hypothetical protein BT69DRAFT_1319208 [Atractiella rhizophila]
MRAKEAYKRSGKSPADAPRDTIMASPTPRPTFSPQVAEPTDERKAYGGACHCQAVKFTVTIPPLETLKLSDCNCSICSKNGYALVYACRDDVHFEKGQGELTAYRFHTKANEHQFCPKCGSSLFVDFKDNPVDFVKPFIGVNVRALEGVDARSLESFQRNVFDGKKNL